jgi:rubrerythrin
MDILDYAIRMEKDGEDYYRRLSRQTDNRGLKTIFTMLAEEEVKHCKAIEEMKSGQPEMARTTILDDAKNVFVQMKESGERFDPDGKQAELYKKAQEIEKKSRDFYREKAAEATEGYQRELFLKLAQEEEKHGFLLENIIEFVRRPETWLEDAEFYHLEEY